MITVSVCVPHVDTPWYLQACLESIKAFSHPEIVTQVIAVDQSSQAHKSVAEKLCAAHGAHFVSTPRVDAGYPIDVALRNATGEYFCSLDCDAWPIHKNWLWLPVQLIKRGLTDWVGADTGLAQAYAMRGKWIHLNNYYRICRTEDAKAASKAVGFMRYENRDRCGHFVPLDKSWEALGKQLHCDNGVIAQWWCRNQKKLSLSVCRALGKTPEMGLYGMVIDDLVFHMVFGYGEEWIPNLMKTLGPDYLKLRERMQKGFGPELIAELVPLTTFNDDYSRNLNGVLVEEETRKMIEEIKRS